MKSGVNTSINKKYKRPMKFLKSQSSASITIIDSGKTHQWILKFMDETSSLR